MSSESKAAHCAEAGSTSSAAQSLLSTRVHAFASSLQGSCNPSCHAIHNSLFQHACLKLCCGFPTATDTPSASKHTSCRMQALGFNTIKLPFSFNALNSGSYGTYQKGCTIASDATIMNNLIEPSVAVANGASFPSVTSPGGSCNSYLPSAPMDRFNWVINYFASNGFYVVSQPAATVPNLDIVAPKKSNLQNRNYHRHYMLIHSAERCSQL